MNTSIGHRHSLLPCFIALLLLGACDSDTTTILPAQPETYAVRGVMRSLPDRAPLGGGTVRVLYEDIEVTTGADGRFELPALGAGRYELIGEAPGYVPSRVQFDTRGLFKTTGFPVNVELALHQGGAGLRVRLISELDETPIAGARVEVTGFTFPDFAAGHEVALGLAQLTGVTDGVGSCVFPDLPATSATLVVYSHDLDGDGIPEVPGTTHALTLTAGIEADATIALGRTDDVIGVVYTNRQPESRQILGDALWFVFSTPMNTLSTATAVTLARYDLPRDPVDFQAIWASPRRLLIRPDASQIPDGTRTSFRMLVVSERGVPFMLDDAYVTWRPFETGPIPGVCEEPATQLRRSLPLSVDEGTDSIELAWEASPCAAGYLIYAKRAAEEYGWTLVDTNDSDFVVGTIEQELAIPQSMDRFLSDDVFTPFAGQELEFAVVPQNALRPGPDEGHARIVIGDETAPAIEVLHTYTSLMSTAGDPLRLEVYVGFDGYLDTSLSPFAIEVREVGGDPDFRLDPTSASWEWRDGGRALLGSFEIEPGTNPCEDEVRVVFTDLVDLAGNSAGPQATEWSPLRCGEYVYSFDQSPETWTVSQGSWEWGVPVDVGPDAGFTSPHCWGTNLSGPYPNAEESWLWSPELLVPRVPTRLEWYYWMEVGAGPDIFSIEVYRPSTNPVQVFSRSASAQVWTRAEVPLADFAGQRIRLLFRFKASSAVNGPGVYVDDVSVRFESEP